MCMKSHTSPALGRALVVDTYEMLRKVPGEGSAQNAFTMIIITKL